MNRFCAITRSNWLAVALLMLGGLTSACTESGEGITPLMYAAKGGHLEQVERLIESGAAVDAESRYSWTALMFAAAEGHTSVVQALLDAGALAGHVSGAVEPGPFATRGGYYPTTALAEAIKGGHLGAADLLMENVDAITPIDLMAAVEVEDMGRLRALVKRGGDPTETTGLTYLGSPLCLAAAKGNLEMVRWLVEEQGVDIDGRSKGTNPLEQAVRSDHVAVVRFLLERGADANATYDDSTMPTVLLVAIKKYQSDETMDQNLEIIEALIASGADSELNPDYSVFGLGIVGERRNAIAVAKAKIEEYRGYYEGESDPEWRARKLARLNHRQSILGLLEHGG
ncbi:MAG: ankyrin repeat domain-containing protein [Verrucomicrobiota bacterium]